MSNNLYETFGVTKPTTFPEMPEAAHLMAMLFRKLGGSFHIDQHGDRRVMIPEPYAFDEGLPSLPGAQPHERFHNGSEYRGAIKLVSGVLSRLHPNDKAFIYGAFAQVFTPFEAGSARQPLATAKEA